jgi:hypothetical protein
MSKSISEHNKYMLIIFGSAIFGLIVYYVCEAVGFAIITDLAKDGSYSFRMGVKEFKNLSENKAVSLFLFLLVAPTLLSWIRNKWPQEIETQFLLVVLSGFGVGLITGNVISINIAVKFYFFSLLFGFALIEVSSSKILLFLIPAAYLVFVLSNGSVLVKISDSEPNALIFVLTGIHVLSVNAALLGIVLGLMFFQKRFFEKTY